MAKFNSGDLLKILRAFGVAGSDHVPRHIEDMKKTQPDEFSEMFSFKFLGDKFYIINDGTAEDDEFYILDLLRRQFGDLEGGLIQNPENDFATFALPFEGKDIYLYKVIPSKRRLDIVLSEKYPDLSRSLIQKYIKNGFVKVNDKIAKKPKYLTSESDLIELDIPQNQAQKVEFPIIFEDKNVIVIDKPRGILTHSKGALNDEFTVADFFANHGAKFAENTNRTGVVHRLDRETSGVIIGAKTTEAAKKLQKQFSERTVKKTYLAVVKGKLSPQKALIDLPIARNGSAPSTFMVHTKGKPSQTEYEVIAENNNFSLVKLTPKTGRTHQLRVHLSYLKHPILGDRVYDKGITRDESLDRMYLHANSLEISLPPLNDGESSRREIFTSPIPEEFTKFTK